MANFKTNVMRILESAGIDYTPHTYDDGGDFTDGVTIAEKVGEPALKVYKTLVTKGTGRDYFVFVLPVADELDLKAAARAVGEKSVEMIKVADINKVTGYVRGGCSPIGMKKEFVTVFDSSCENLDKIFVSAGKRGYQIELSPKDLVRISKGKTAKIAADL